MSLPLAAFLFLAGAVLAVWATERLLEGLVSLSTVLRVSAFAIGVVLSGLEAENIAVGLASGASNAPSIALGSVFGGAIFLVCVAFGLGVVIAPLDVKLPRGILAVFALSPVVVGLGLIAPVTPRWAGVVLLVAFVLSLGYILVVSRKQTFLLSHEVEKAQGKQHRLWPALGLTVLGIVEVSIGGEMVAEGAKGLVLSLGIPATLMGMVITPAAIEAEEVIRQAIPAKRGRSDVSAGNLIGTLLYFLLCNFGLIMLITPVTVDPLVQQLDWPFLVGVMWLATALLWRGRVGRGAGAVLLAAYGLYILLHLLFR